MASIDEMGGRQSRLQSEGSTPHTTPGGGSAQATSPQLVPTPLIVGVICAALVLVGGFLVFKSRSTAAGKAAAGAGKGPPAVPVGAGTVLQKDVPIYLDGLGTAQAFNTVTVRARVDGQVDRVAFVEGQDVHVGDVLAQIDPKPFQAALDQAKAKKGEDEAQLANARLVLARDKDLLASKILAQQDYDTQQALVAQLQATVAADEAAIESAKVQLDYTTIRSPLDGRTGVRLVDQGNIIHASDSNGLVTITQLRPISILFTLPEQTLPEIQAQRAQGELTVLAVGRDNRASLGSGKLAVIDNQIDPSTGTIRLKATFANEDLRLWPGQFVNVRLLLTTRKGGLVVPEAVIQRGPEGSYAFVIKGDKGNLSVEVRKVTVAQTDSGEALIDAGLQAGERVVVDGQYRLQAGSKVKVREGKDQAPAADTGAQEEL